MMRKVKIENLQAKVIIEKQPDCKDASAPSSLEIEALNGERLFFRKAIDPKYFAHFAKITVFLKVSNKWKPYPLVKFWPGEDEREFGKVDNLVFQLDGQNQVNQFKTDLEGARC